MYKPLALVLTLAVLLTACSDSDPTPPVASGEIGTAGGTVSVTTGTLNGAVITIPSGALTQATNVQIYEAAVVVVAGFRVIGPAAGFEPGGQTFGTASTLTMPFDPALLTTGAPTTDIVVKTRASSGLLTDITPTTIDTATGLITFTHTEFARHWIAVKDTFRPLDYFPLGSGDHYLYDNNSLLTVEATTTEPNFGGSPVIKLTLTGIGCVNGLYLTESSGTISRMGEFEICSRNEQEVQATGTTWLALYDTIGTSRAQTYTYTGYQPYGGLVPRYTGLHNETTDILRRTSVSTALKTFSDVIEVEFTTTFSETPGPSGTKTLHLWLAKGVGPVLYSDSNVIRSLVAATVGGAPVTR